MKKLETLFDANRRWAAERTDGDPTYFTRLAELQAPRYLWIGCSDSRVPANVITGLEPGEVFVHRNVANLVVHTDMSCLSVLQFAVEVLRVEHVIVCGHYGCGGVSAAMGSRPLGLIDNWLRHIKDVAARHHSELSGLADDEARLRRLTELNVAAQVANLCHTTIVQDAWARSQALDIHGWVYDLGDGLLRDLDLCISSIDQLADPYRMD